MTQPIAVGIVGGGGYAGAELLRLLSDHPGAAITAVTSRSAAGTPVWQTHPHLRGHVDLAFCEPSVEQLADCDVVFFATPHGTAMSLAPALLDAGKRVIDLSADFRLVDELIWAHWYGQPHASPQWLGQAVYGLPELNRDRIADARLIACPGCYPTTVGLGLKPLLDAGLVDTQSLIADAKTGVSGGGKALKPRFMFSQADESFQAYAVAGHRHLPEIRQTLATMAGEAVNLTFVPHLVPMIRGMQATLYARPARTCDWQACFENAYANEPFVDVLPVGHIPETRHVRATNRCMLSVVQPEGSDHVIVLSVIDNLIKGASGQAVQCFNIMTGQPETRALDAAAALP